jgi:hypothetical protein
LEAVLPLVAGIRYQFKRIGAAANYPHLDLKNASSYAEQLRSLVPEAIQVARNHQDAYIRRPLEISMGSE